MREAGLAPPTKSITDRAPAKRLVRQGRIIDLSRAAFETLAPPNLGLIPVRLYQTSDGGD